MALFIPASFNANARLRTRRHRFRLDMTPLVDLAFLLLTFFLLYVGMAKPRIMQLTMPAKDTREYSCRLVCSHVEAVTIILGSHHRLHYYLGANNPSDTVEPPPEARTTDFGSHGIRKILLAWRSQMPEPVILIKPSPQATYKDVVDILDEMNITNQKKYALVKLPASDAQLLRQAGY